MFLFSFCKNFASTCHNIELWSQIIPLKCLCDSCTQHYMSVIPGLKQELSIQSGSHSKTLYERQRRCVCFFCFFNLPRFVFTHHQRSKVVKSFFIKQSPHLQVLSFVATNLLSWLASTVIDSCILRVFIVRPWPMLLGHSPTKALWKNSSLEQVPLCVYSLLNNDILLGCQYYLWKR